MRFNAEAGTEVSGVFPNGEVWTVKFSTTAVTPKDEHIAEALQRLADDPDSPISVSKGK